MSSLASMRALGLTARSCDNAIQLFAMCIRCMRLTGCSSLWDEFRTSTDRLACVPCCYRRFCASDGIQNDFERHIKLTSGSAAGKLARILAFQTRPYVFRRGGPWLG
eukprot:3323466-Pleurochrysis_carterae.AAC.1